jgi:hypothetical protein
LGLTDEETCVLVGIDPDTLVWWKKDLEFFGSIKGAVATWLVKRLKRIESGTDGWQGSACLTEPLLPARYAKPEVQISLNSSFSSNHNALTLTTSLEEARQIEERAAPIREADPRMLEDYQCNRGRSSSPSREVSGEADDADPSSEPTISQKALGRG